MSALEDLIGIPVPADTIARALRRHPKYRVLTMIEQMDRRESRWDRTDQITVGVVDVETTGLDWRTDRIIEFAIQQACVDAHGRIVTTGRPAGWFEDPGIPIPPQIIKKTKITDEMVRGKAIPEGEAYGSLMGVDVLLSHNAAFDRPFIEKRFGIPPKPWICSLRDIDWEDHGFSSLKLEHLLHGCNWFFDGAHRAVNDVNALLHLLDHPLDTGRTVMKELWANALAPNWLVEVAKPPYDKWGLLRERGYSRDAHRKVWWTHVPEGRQLAEERWLLDEVLFGGGFPSMRPVSWRERYAGVDDA